MAWFLTQDYSEFQLIRQGVLLDFMQVVEAAGISFAYPTRTVHWTEMPPVQPSKPGQPSGVASTGVG
jgi:MscS family membrane protein